MQFLKSAQIERTKCLQRDCVDRGVSEAPFHLLTYNLFVAAKTSLLVLE